MDISKRILTIMDTRGMNKKMLADRLGMPSQNINSTVLNNPKFEVLERVAAALDVSLSELVEEEKAQPPEPRPSIRCPYCGQRIILTAETD